MVLRLLGYVKRRVPFFRFKKKSFVLFLRAPLKKKVFFCASFLCLFFSPLFFKMTFLMRHFLLKKRTKPLFIFAFFPWAALYFLVPFKKKKKKSDFFRCLFFPFFLSCPSFNMADLWYIKYFNFPPEFSSLGSQPV